MLTIGRNRRQYIRNVRDTYTECRRYDPASGEMVRAEADDAWTFLEINKDARLIEHEGRRSYTIRLGEDFFELRKPVSS
jgi:hypothetical protein